MHLLFPKSITRNKSHPSLCALECHFAPQRGNALRRPVKLGAVVAAESLQGRNRANVIDGKLLELGA